MEEITTVQGLDQAKKVALRDDWMGGAIVLSLLFVFLCLIGYAFYAAASAPRESYEKTLGLLNQILSAVSGLLGLGLGSYLASGKSSR